MDGTLSFGDWLRRRRRLLDLTQAELAERVGCAEGTIRKFEAELLRPSKHMALRLAEECGITPADQEFFITFARDHTRFYAADALPPSLQIAEVGAPPLASITANIAANFTGNMTGNMTGSAGNNLGSGAPNLPPLPETAASLPIPATPLLGRQLEIEAVCHQLAQPNVRLLTLVGPPGVGKTHLAMKAAAALVNNFDGLLFVPLAAVQEAERVLSAIARGLDVVESDGRTLLAALQATLYKRTLLLVLDNMEQVAEAGRFLVELLTVAEGVKILVTSRIALRVSGEHLYNLEPLAIPDLANLPPLARLQENASVALFVARAKATRHDFALTPANAEAVATICARLDGLPLAIELAAARVKLYPPSILLARLQRPLDLLTQGARDRLPHQQTLRDAIRWSYTLLTPTQQRLFMRLGVFADGCTLAAAAAVCNADSDLGKSLEEVYEEMEALLDQSLLRQTEQGDEIWLTMLVTLREFALEQLAASGEEERIRLHHLRYFRALCEEGTAQVQHAEQPHWLERFTVDYENVRAALAWGLDDARVNEELAQDALIITGTAWWTWWAVGLGSEARAWIHRALAHAHVITIGRANALFGAGRLGLYVAGGMAGARTYFEDALAHYRHLNELTGQADSLLSISHIAAMTGQPDEASTMLEESIELFHAARRQYGRDHWRYGLALLSRRFVTLSRGDLETAQQEGKRALDFFRTLGQPSGIAAALNALGDIARVRGDFAQAAVLYEEAMTQIYLSRVKNEVPSILHNLAYTLLALGQVERSRNLFSQALLLQQHVENIGGMAECLTGLAGVAVMEGDGAWAAQLFGAVARLYEQMGGLHWLPERTEYDRYLTATRALLPAESFDEAWQRGRALTLAAVVEAALLGYVGVGVKNVALL